MDLESKLSDIIQLLLGSNQSKKISLQLHNDVFARINTFVYLSQDPRLPKIPETTKTLVLTTFDELRQILKEVETGEDGLFQMAKQLLINSPQKKLEAMIPKLLNLSDRIIQELTVQKYLEQTTNGKRRFSSLEHNESADKIEAMSLVSKKVKMNEDTQEQHSNEVTESRFQIKMICHPKLNSKFALKDKHMFSRWSNKEESDLLVLRRDDFLCLPMDLVVKISKEHARIRGWKNKVKIEEANGGKQEPLNYQITDSSVNGTYYLGNKMDGMSKQKPMKLQKDSAFQLRNGDCIGVLMDKEAKTNEMLVGFEFEAGENDKEDLEAEKSK